MTYTSFSPAWPVAAIPLISGKYVPDFVRDGGRLLGVPGH